MRIYFWADRSGNTITFWAFHPSSFHKAKCQNEMVCTNAPTISIWPWPVLSCWHTRVLGLLTRRANSTIAVLPLEVFFVAHWAHAIGARIPIKPTASGTQHRHLATVRFLSHPPFSYKPEIDTHNPPSFRGLRKPFFYSWHLKIWNFL